MSGAAMSPTIVFDRAEPHLVIGAPGGTFITMGILQGILNVIDFDRLGLEIPVMTNDLPAGAGRLIQRARGYVATIVSGQVTFREGEHVGPLPGKLVRGAQPAPA